MTARIMQIWITGQKTMNAIRRRDIANFLGLGFTDTTKCYSMQRQTHELLK